MSLERAKSTCGPVFESGGSDADPNGSTAGGDESTNGSTPAVSTGLSKTISLPLA
jgi:hypothetical protein